MADIFQAMRGTIVRQQGVSASGFVKIEDFPTGSLLMITNVQSNRAQVVQYIKTLDTANFGYAWGEGPGQIRVSGLIFFVSGCSINGEGPSSVNDWYDSNNVYNSDGGERIVTIGKASFRGYLEKLQIAAEQNEYNYGTFSLEFTILPKG